MPRLRRLNGKELVKLFQRLGFKVVRIRGSHHHMRRVVDGQGQNLNEKITISIRNMDLQNSKYCLISALFIPCFC